jgi:hypothetical protein
VGAGSRTQSRVVIVCESAQHERLAAEHVALLVADSGVVIEQPAALLRRRSARRRLALQLCSHRHLGRRVLLVRRLDGIHPGALGRLRKWLSGGHCPAEWQILTLRLPPTRNEPGIMESIEQALEPDLLIRLDAHIHGTVGLPKRRPVRG